MKIGQISHIYRPHIGGIENYIHRLKNSLEDRGHKVSIYTTDLSVQGTDKREKNTVYCKSNFALIRNPFSFELAKILKNSNEDIYHLHNPWFLPSLLATKMLKGKPKVMTVHGAKVEEKDLVTWLLNRTYHPFAQYILENMDMLMAQGEKERDRLLCNFKLSPDRIIVVPNGIEISKFNLDKEANEEFIEKYNLREDSFKILYVSRLVDAKNPKKIISSVMRYMKHQNIEVILIGEGSPEYITKLKGISDDRIHILGELSFKELNAAYHISDLFIFLGLWEGMPTVIMEAMLCGLPILTTPVAGIPDVATEGENGLFVKVPISEEDLANKISYFMNEADINKISKANIEKVKTQYDWDIVANKILDVYNEVLEGCR